MTNAGELPDLDVPLTIGAGAAYGDDWRLDGAIDEVTLYDRALTSSEVASIAAAGSSGKCCIAAGGSSGRCLPLCGNGALDSGEDCDDGDTDDTNGCTNSCTVCGNGTTTAPEECDDGNLVNGDSCDANCTLTGCGNGVVTPGEACDDGNDSDADACLVSCVLNVCGDGFVRTGVEECDDGNATGGDGCETDCTSSCSPTAGGIVAWWRAENDARDDRGEHDGTPRGTVTYVPGKVGAAFHFDGTSWIDVPDDPGLTLGSHPFTIELWARFDQINGSDPLIGHDDGGGGEKKWIFWLGYGHRAPSGTGLRLHINSASLGALDPVAYVWASEIDRWFHLAITRSGSTYKLYIDGVAVITESDSHTIPDPSVPLTIGRAEGFRFYGAIDEVTLYDRALSATEIASIAAAGSGGKCGSCGDGTVDASEECDDGNTANGDGCDLNCTHTGCGNGIVTAGETCDDGNVDNTDDCVTTCLANVCGDGFVHAGVEECDDGNLSDGDGCDSSCTRTVCGNGIPTAGEGCDDGNFVNGDGCDANCSATGNGNGIVTAGEECDDGNLVDGDGCDADGRRSCGNASLDGNPVEACDDGNRIDGDGCDSNCTPTTCGNGIVTTGEDCDDGNALEDDNCDASCHSICLVPPTGLIAWWPGNGNAHDVIGGRNGTVVGGVTYPTGKVHEAFRFNATNMLDVADDPIWTLGSAAFTIDLWVNFARLQGRDPFIAHDEDGGSRNKWIFWYDESGHRAPDGPALRFHINSPSLGPLDPIVYPWVPTPGQWYHVAVTRSGTTYALYIDGVQVIAEEDAHVLPDPAVPLTIGKAEAYLFDGALDEVEIYDRALSAAEIQTIYASGAIGKCLPCGNRAIDPNEQCDDGNAVTDDGCEPSCVFTPEGVSTTAAAGEAVTTDGEGDGATPTDPIETGVRAPAGGTVTIDEDPGAAAGDYAFFSHRIHIEAPPATPEVPLVIAFRIDASQLPAGTDLETIQVFKNGVAVPSCTATDASADPDPCVGSRTLAGDGDMEIVALTSSASFWTFGLCGNSAVDTGEQCDDGNGASGDGCSQCRVDIGRLVPGTGMNSNCALEWLVPGGLRLDGHDLPKAVVECTAGDPSCDFTPADQACTFHVTMCYGARDPGFACEPRDLRYLLLTQPSLKSVDPADVANRAALGAAPANLGGTVGGVCTNRASLNASCALNSACNSGPGKRDGKCRRLVAFAPALPAALQCSAYASITVPLKGDGRGTGTRKLQLSTLPSGVPVLEKAPNGDIDTIKLVCRP